MTAKLTTVNDLTTRMTKRQPVTSVLQDSGQKSSIETFVLYLKFWLRFKVSNIDPLPRKAVSRQAVKKLSFLLKNIISQSNNFVLSEATF
jgi:hypothetical protein